MEWGAHAFMCFTASCQVRTLRCARLALSLFHSLTHTCIRTRTHSSLHFHSSFAVLSNKTRSVSSLIIVWATNSWIQVDSLTVGWKTWNRLTNVDKTMKLPMYVRMATVSTVFVNIWCVAVEKNLATTHNQLALQTREEAKTHFTKNVQKKNPRN